MTIILAAFAGVVSILFWRFQAMPAPDLVSFLQVGKEIWSGRIPSDFMRAPLFGLIVYPLGLAVGSAWTAALLVNAILYPLNVSLVYLVIRPYLPRAAFPLAILFAANVFVLEMLTRTLCETLLIFLCLLTLWLLARDSMWAYLAGALATITRYDAIGVLIAAILAGLLRRRYRRALLLGILSLMPLATWMLGTWLSLRKGEHVHYVKLLSLSGLFELKGWNNLFLATLWPIPCSIFTIIFGLLMIVYGMWAARAGWSLYLFGATYGGIHLMYQFQEPRMYVPITWLVPMLVVAACYRFLQAARVFATICLSLVLAITLLAQVPMNLGNGMRDVEFRKLIEWRKANLPADHKMLTSMADLLRIADPSGASCYVPLRQVQGEIHQYCKDQGITYFVWDSRLLHASDATVWYDRQTLAQWQALAAGQDLPGWKYVVTIRNPANINYYIHIYQVQ